MATTIVDAQPRKAHLKAWAGDDFVADVYILDEDGNAVDITGWTFTAQVDDPNGVLVASFTCTPIDEVGGHLTVALSEADTTAISDVENCVWDLQAVVSGVTKTYLYGYITAGADVT